MNFMSPSIWVQLSTRYASTTTWMWEVERIRTNIGHIRVKMSGTYFPDRVEEHKVLMSEGWEDLKGTKYDWLTNLGNLSRQRQCEFKVLRESILKTARAWAIKALAMRLWNYVSRTWAEKRWKQWLSWALRCRLEPVKDVAKLIKAHLWGIVNTIILKVTNGGAESINSRIKMLKIRGRGFRNKARYKNAIYFHLGGLDLYPEGVSR